jgi:hypothetical protein
MSRSWICVCKAKNDLSDETCYLCGGASTVRVKESKPLKRVPIKKVSEKRKVDNKEYKVLREEFLKANPKCQMNLINCTGIATEVHHTAKRGGNYLNVSTFMAACRDCHEIAETVLSAKDRREMGFLTTVTNKPTI